MVKKKSPETESMSYLIDHGFPLHSVQHTVGKGSCKIYQDICRQYGVAHEELVFPALVSPRGIQSHPIGVEIVGYRPARPAVIGCQGRVVQSPVL